MILFHQLAIPFVALTVVNGQVVATCPNNITVNVEWGESSAPVSWTEPRPPSPSYTKTFQTHSQGMLPLGISLVTYEFSDQYSQETTSCTFAVTVQSVDDEPPVISNCPESQIETEFEVGISNVPGNWPEPSATDNSGHVVLVERSFPPDKPLYIADKRNYQVTYTFEDASGNRAHCTFNVRFVPVDTTPPTVKYCPNLVSEIVPLEAQGTVVTLSTPDVTDNSGQLSVRIEPDISNNYFNVGITPLKYIYTDPSGNEATCDVNVHVVRQDISPPVLIYCPDSTTFGVHADVGETFVDWDQPIAEDDSGTVLVKVDADPGIFSIGTVKEVHYEICDLARNHVSCTFVINVIEDEDPPRIFGCPQDGIVAVLSNDETVKNVTWAEPFAKDETYLKPPKQNYYSGDAFELGITTVKYLFADSAGNFAVCQFDVEVSTLVDDNEGVPENTVALAAIVTVSVTLVVIIAVITAVIAIHFAQRKTTPTMQLSSPTPNDGLDRSYTALAISKRPLPSIKDASRQTTDEGENKTSKKDENYYLTPASS